MAFNLPLFTLSPVSDLDCRWLPPALQFPDKCVYSFWSHICQKKKKKSHIWFTTALTDTMDHKALIQQSSQSGSISQKSQMEEVSRGGSPTSDGAGEEG